MSLEKHYQAARREIDGGGESYYIAWGYPDEDDVRGKLDAEAMARNAVNAFLSSLADDPPEEMVEAMCADWPWAGKRARLKQLQSAALSAALREAGRSGGGREGPG